MALLRMLTVALGVLCCTAHVFNDGDDTSLMQVTDRDQDFDMDPRRSLQLFDVKLTQMFNSIMKDVIEDGSKVKTKLRAIWASKEALKMFTDGLGGLSFDQNKMMEHVNRAAENLRSAQGNRSIQNAGTPEALDEDAGLLAAVLQEYRKGFGFADTNERIVGRSIARFFAEGQGGEPIAKRSSFLISAFSAERLDELRDMQLLPLNAALEKLTRVLSADGVEAKRGVLASVKAELAGMASKVHEEYGPLLESGRKGKTAERMAKARERWELELSKGLFDTADQTLELLLKVTGGSVEAAEFLASIATLSPRAR